MGVVGELTLDEPVVVRVVSFAVGVFGVSLPQTAFHDFHHIHLHFDNDKNDGRKL